MSEAAAAASHLLELFQARWTDPSRASSLALRDERRSYTYAELHESVGRCAGWLHGAGVRHGDRIALAMERSAELVICILGAMAAGACPCPQIGRAHV